MKIALSVLLGASSLALTACDVDKTKEGNLPDVDVNVSGGELPEYNVTAPTVTVGSENKTVEVPTVDVEPAKDADGNSAN
jgi:hypothetical protein